MIRFIVFAALLLVLSGFTWEATASQEGVRLPEPKDEWLSEDKLLHALTSAYLVGFSYRIYHAEFKNPEENSRVFAVSLSAAAGVGKEAWDMRASNHKASWKDLVADATGIIIGLLLFTHVD